MIRLFRVFIPKSVVALILFDALLAYACFLLAAYWYYAETLELYLFYEGGLFNISIAVASVILAVYFQNMYTDFRISSRALLVQELFLVVGVVFLSQALLAYISLELILSRWVMIVACILVLLSFVPWRLLYTQVLYKGLGIDRVLFLGSDTTGVAIAECLAEKPQLGYSAAGFVDDGSPPGSKIANVPVIGPVSELAEIVKATRPDRIIVNLAERRQALPVDVLLDLRFSGLRIEEAALMYEAAFGRINTRTLRPSQLIFSAELGPQRWKMQLQTVYSFFLALVGLVLSVPFMLVTAIAVRLTSRGPILFRQTRVGLNGKPFTLFKFRSMVVDAEAHTGAVWAKKNDPRVTRIGGFLRKTRLDELPQLFNVLAGQMAIVGPRPERPEFVSVLSEQIPFYRQRHAVKPGVTGWAQINYKYGENVEDTIMKLEYDLYYIKNLSPSLDAYVVFHTLKVMLFSSHGQ
jgi:exopolysaccharide biosynthesis polyprenyl glycosylphosphotransferase